MKNQTKLWIAAVLLPVAAHAAGTISKPVLGYVFEPSAKTIRVIAGVPGAAILDDALPSASKLERVFVAPGRPFAIVEHTGGEAPAVLRWTSSEVAESPVEGALAGVSAAAFSAGEFAAVYHKDYGKIQIWRGLPDAPELSRTIAAGDVRALAISDDGALVAASQENGIAIYEATEARVVAGGDFPAIAFVPGTHDLLAAQPGSDRVVRIAGGEVVEFATVQAVSTLAVSRDGRWVAMGAAGGLFVAGGGSVFRATETPLSAAAALRGDAVFLLSGDEGAQWVLDMDSGTPRLVLAGGVE